MKLTHLALPVLVSLGVFASTHAGAATNLFDPTVSTSNKLDASAITLNGTLHDTNGNSQPWTSQFYAQAGECMRLQVTSANGVDMKMVVLAPNGEAFRDDDSNGNLLPIVKIAGAPNTGWYTVQIAHFNGAPQVDLDFVMKYGRYNGGNPNCANPTLPFSQINGSQAKDPSAAPPAQAHNPDAP